MNLLHTLPRNTPPNVKYDTYDLKQLQNKNLKASCIVGYPM